MRIVEAFKYLVGMETIAEKKLNEITELLGRRLKEDYEYISKLKEEIEQISNRCDRIQLEGRLTRSEYKQPINRAE